MSYTNLNCEHTQLFKTNIDFCKNCSCILIVQNETILDHSLIDKQHINKIDYSPIDSFKIIFNSQKDFSKIMNSSNLSEEYSNRRPYLINLLREYYVEYKYSDKCFFLGIYLLDLLMCSVEMGSTFDLVGFTKDDFEKTIKYDLVVLSVFVLSIKFLEDDSYSPLLDSFVNKKNPSILYSLTEVRKYETFVLRLLRYKLDYYTSYFITETILTHGVIFNEEMTEMGISNGKRIKEIVKDIWKLAVDLNMSFVYSNDFLLFSPFEIATTSIRIAKESKKFKKPIFSNDFSYLYRVEEYSECYNSMMK